MKKLDKAAVLLISAVFCAVITGCAGHSADGTADVSDAGDTVSAAFAEDAAEEDIMLSAEPVFESEFTSHIGSYAYEMLSENERALYDKILLCAERLMENVPGAESSTDEEWLRAYGCVYNQEPQLFYMSPKVLKGTLFYRETDPAVILRMKDEIDMRINSLCEAAEGMSDREKLRCFHDRIIRMNDFDQTGDYSQTVYGGLVLGGVQCEGYAKTLHFLCRRSGIPSMVVTGSNSDDDSHAWDIVMAGGEWYNIDCTWDDPILDVADPGNLRYKYFLVPDMWIHGVSHFNINRKIGGVNISYFEVPQCVSYEYNYFYANGLVFSDADSADTAIREMLSDAVSSKRRVTEIMMSSDEAYEEIKSRLSEYSKQIKSQSDSVVSVSENCDDELLIIEIDLNFDYYFGND